MEICHKTRKRKHGLICLQSYNEGSWAVRCVGLNIGRLYITCFTMSERNHLVGLRLPAPAFIVRLLSKSRTLTTASHQKLAVYRNTTSYVRTPECFWTHLAPTLTTHTDPCTSSSLLNGASLGSHSQIHLKKQLTQTG